MPSKKSNDVCHCFGCKYWELSPDWRGLGLSEMPRLVSNWEYFNIICWRPTLLPKQITCTLHHILSQPLSPEWLSHIDNQHVDLTNYESQQVIWVWQDCICSIDFWSQTFESWHEVWSTSQLIQANNHWKWLICETTNQSTLFFFFTWYLEWVNLEPNITARAKCVHNDI